MPVQAATGILTESDDLEVIVGIKYTSSHFREFLWGVSRPVHLWNSEADGKKVILPFWLHPFQAGGILGWTSPDAWKYGKTLNAGSVAGEVGMAILLF